MKKSPNKYELLNIFHEIWNYSLQITFYQLYACKLVFLHFNVLTKKIVGISCRKIVQT